MGFEESRAEMKYSPKRVSPKFTKYKSLLQIVLGIIAFSILYIYTVKAHPSNGFIQLTAFTLIYTFVTSIGFGFIFRYFTGEGVSLGVIFFEFFYTMDWIS